ncbi:uncharacterized protein LOC111054391 [Nilaparvata lugens]|uniref:uncharacterized protein LOC111054391 n=1 Tax=Nilaparvata lugens TaxID=108931 RepID=UPI00193D3506|nr:uncharacterized protein LOC111054391 [Nilaparvata lugens]
MCCFIPRMNSSFCFQLNIVAGFLVMLILYTVYFTLRFINIFSKQCNYFVMGNGTHWDFGQLEEIKNATIVKDLHISLPLVECCDKYFNTTVWNVVILVMFILCLFLLFTFCYLNDQVLLIAIGAFMMGCFVNLILQIVALVAPIIEETQNKPVCFIENGLMIFGYIYMIIILNSYYFMVDDNKE